MGPEKMGPKEPKKHTRRTRKPRVFATTLSVRTYADPPTSAWLKLWATMLRDFSAELDGEGPHAPPAADVQE